MNTTTATLSTIRVNRQGYDALGCYYGAGKPVILVEVKHADGRGETVTHRGDKATVKTILRRCHAGIRIEG